MIASNEPSAVGIFDNLDKAERTIDELRRAGFEPNEIGIIGHVGPDQTVPTPPETHVPEENAVNAFARGGIIGALVGAVVMLAIPGLAEIAGLGRWFEVVGGAALGAIVCGLLVAFGSFVFMRPKTRVYAAELDKGHFIVTVKNSARKEEAVSVLRRQGVLVDSAGRDSGAA
jgi:hypothetical protein